MLFFKNQKRDVQGNSVSLVANYNALMRQYPLAHKSFLSSFDDFLKRFQIKNGSLFFFESKATQFILKKWIGLKPARFAISENYEIIKYLKIKKSPLIKSEFAKSTHDLRQPALFFFQQTISTHIFPVMSEDGEAWHALMMLDLSEGEASILARHPEVIQLYVRELAHWFIFQALFEKHQKLSEIAHVKNQLLANVSHELQTPLNGILGISEAILDGVDGVVSPELLEHVKMIRDSGQTLHNTINNFLQLAQIEARKSEIRHHKTNICELLTEVISLFQDSLSRRNIAVKCLHLEKPVYVFVDPDQIRTVLMNLLSNASKFTEAGEVTVGLKKSGEMLHVSVTDTGIGIDPEKLHLIFEEFYQGDGSHTRIYGGTGLGLAIAKKIVSLHGGRIWAMPHGKQGTSFTFTVPLCPGV